MRRPLLDSIPVSGQKSPSSFMLYEAFPSSSLASPRAVKLLIYVLSTISDLQGCFLQQFFRSVGRTDYLTLRHGFIAVSQNFNSLLYLPPALVMFMGESPLGPFSSWTKVRLPEIYQKIIGRRFQGGSWNKVHNTKHKTQFTMLVS